MNVIEKGQRAKSILEDELVQDAFVQLEDILLTQWRESKTTEDREELWFTLKGLDRFKKFFEIAVDSGRFELVQLEGNE